MPIWVAGLVAGLIAGIVMAVAATMAMPLRGQSMLSPVKLMAGTIQGEAALEGTIVTVLLGLMLHMMMSAVLGVIFALLLAGLGWHGLGLLIVAGIVYALIVFAINWFGTVPIVDKVMAARMSPVIFGLTHIIYGGVLGLLVRVFAGPHV